MRTQMAARNFDLVGDAIEALVKLQTPKFDGLDEEFVFEVFRRVYAQVDFDEFKKRVAALSGGSVELQQIDPKEYPFGHVMGVARYFVLVKDGQKVYGTFGPYFPPFQLHR